jgi:hypothetical protein
VVHHRWQPLNDVFVWLSNVGNHGLVWLGVGVALSLAWRRAASFVLVVLADALSDGLAALLKTAVEPAGRPAADR